MGLSISDEIVGAGVSSIENFELGAALDATRSVPKCWFAEAIPMVVDPVLFPDLLEGQTRMAKF